MVLVPSSRSGDSEARPGSLVGNLNVKNQTAVVNKWGPQRIVAKAETSALVNGERKKEKATIYNSFLQYISSEITSCMNWQHVALRGLSYTLGNEI